MTQTIFDHQFDNGLTLVAEPMPWLESLACSITVPGGCQYDPPDRLGLSNYVCEMIQRGCGKRNSREFIEDLEFLGVDFSSSVSAVHGHYAAAMPADSIGEALPIFADLLRDPMMPVDQFEDGRRVCFQEILAIEDDLPQQLMQELRRRSYPDPLGRSSTGTMDGIEATTLDEVQSFYERYYRPNGTIVSFAGKFDWEELRDQVAACFESWEAKEVDSPAGRPPRYGTHHIDHESSQTQIGVSFDSVPYSHPDYFLARAGVGVLSDGMSSRLFTEIREKRGLCYSVYASYHSSRGHGNIVAYAGTSTDRAQETLDVLTEELMRLKDGVTENELDRLKVQFRSNLIMQQESSRSRASSIVGDWYHLGRPRTLDELNEIIQDLTTARINEYFESHPPTGFTLVTLGSQALEAPVAISTSQAG